jgi:transcriptional regulatory protein LEU3
MSADWLIDTVQVRRDDIVQKTEARSIDALDLSPGVIDKCFELFFTIYHPLLPVVDPTITPNGLYHKSPTLFWVVVSIGSRKHPVFPNLICALSPRISSIVLSSLSSHISPLESIKAILLLLEWPFPATSYRRDPSFMLAGALVQLALQYGLHVPQVADQVGADAPLKLGLSCHVDIKQMERSQLWARIIILYQR